MVGSNARLLDWMEGQGLSKETAMYDGVRILGFMALLPLGSVLEISDLGDTNALLLAPAVKLVGCPPLENL